MISVVEINNSLHHRARFFRGDDRDKHLSPQSVRTWSVEEVWTFPDGVEALLFETVLATRATLSDGRVIVSEVVAASSSHYLIKKIGVDADEIGPNSEEMPVHPNFVGKFRILRQKAEEPAEAKLVA